MINPVKIKVQHKLSIASAILLSVLIFSLGCFFVYISETGDFVSSTTKYKVYGFLGLIAIFIPMWLRNAFNKDEYVSDIILDDEKLTLVYMQKKFVREEHIQLSNIENIHAELSANKRNTGRYTTLFCETNVLIKTLDGKYIRFTENPTGSFSLCNYAFLLSLMNISSRLPNFTYKVTGNAEEIKKDVEHYMLYGKRLPFFKRLMISLKKIPVFAKIILSLYLVFLIVSLGLLAYISIPYFVNSEDKEYASIIEKGYKYYQNNMYRESIYEYDKALKIHNDDSTLYYYRALSYYYDKNYNLSSIEAQKGIDVLSKKSAYHKVKNYKFINDAIGLYTTLGNSEYKLNNYKNAIEAYNYVINHVKYTYTDIYFKRGMCEFYLNDKTSALSDFYRHKEIILQYFEDQENSEYKDKYPVYKQSNLLNIEKWIDACK